jgi:nitroreductase
MPFIQKQNYTKINMTKPYDVPNSRKPDYPIDQEFLKRWSPRSISNKNFTEKDLMSLFEAARWSPSSSNIQPWRFLYALKGSKEWDRYFGFLVEFNQMWCKDAGALILVASRNTSPNKFGKEEQNYYQSFDTGAAWMSLALQARKKNFVAHAMGGFDKDKAKKELKIPNNYKVECMIAVGSQGNIEDIHERMQKNEKPNTRNPVKDFTSKGDFPKNWK